MAKHSVKVTMWNNGFWSAPETHGTVMDLAVHYGLLAIPRTAPKQEQNWNYLEQQPEEMGFVCPSFRVPGKGTRLNPVDAYSADGDLFPLDNEGHLAGMRRGIWNEGTTTHVGVGPNERYFLKKNDRELIAFTGYVPDAHGTTWTYTTDGGYLMYHPQQQIVTAEFYFFGYDSTAGYLRRLVAYPTFWNMTPGEWDRLKGMSIHDMIVRVLGYGFQWEGDMRFPAYPCHMVNTSPPPLRGNFDDLISLAADPGWEQLARDAYNNIEAGFDGNGIALVSDLTHSVSSARDTAKAISKIGSKGKRIKAIANTYLSFRYGWKLLMSDVSELSKSMRRSIASRFTRCTALSSSSHDGVTTISTYQVYYDKYGGILGDMSALDQLTSDLDLEMSLGNAWDMVKYSFVLDWFADVGSVLESMDSYYNVAYRYDVVAAGKSQKVSRTRSIPGYCGFISETAYRRRYEKDAIPPSPLPATHQPRSQSWIDGAALVVQRL